MGGYRCPRCGQAVPSWQPVHLSCLIHRMRRILGGLSIIVIIVIMIIVGATRKQTTAVSINQPSSGSENNLTVSTTKSPVPKSPIKPTDTTVTQFPATQTRAEVKSAGDDNKLTNDVNSPIPLQATETLLINPKPTLPYHPTPSPTKTSQDKSALMVNPWIAYAYGQDRNDLDIYISNLVTGEIKQVTSNRFPDQSPTFSPDGRFLAYNGCRPDCEIYIMDLQSYSERQITDSSPAARFPDWCNDLSSPWIVFESSPDKYTHNVKIVNVDSGETKTLTKVGADSRPAWSDDCNAIVFGRATRDTDGNGKVTTNDFLDVYTVELDTLDITQLTYTTDQDEFNYAWSPDGEWIAFTRVSKDTNNDSYVNLDDQSGLFIMHTDGSGQINLTQGYLSVFSPFWSPDGKNIIFTAFFSSEQQEIWIYSLETLGFTQITRRGGYYHPAWSP